jgi:cytochrome c553
MMGLEPTTFCMASEPAFASVRSCSLKRPARRASVQASERERTRANAEPCHSCHGVEGLLVRPELLGTLKHLRSAIQLSARVRAYAKDDSDLDPIRV